MDCEMCKVEERIPKQRFCKKCKKIFLAKLKETGYLQSTTACGRYTRPAEQRENIQDTKYGSDRF
jgi:hypothetical protein